LTSFVGAPGYGPGGSTLAYRLWAGNDFYIGALGWTDLVIKEPASWPNTNPNGPHYYHANTDPVPYSDILRFTWDANGDPAVYVYSNLAEPGEVAGPADVGVPSVWNDGGSGHPAAMTEVGSDDGNNGVTYTPLYNPDAGWGMPGAEVEGVYDVTYHFTSDVTTAPEPSTFALLGVGAMSLLACVWRRRRQSA
jgi:hypothetical protein